MHCRNRGSFLPGRFCNVGLLALNLPAFVPAMLYCEWMRPVTGLMCLANFGPKLFNKWRLLSRVSTGCALGSLPRRSMCSSLVDKEPVGVRGQFCRSSGERISVNHALTSFCVAGGFFPVSRLYSRQA